MRNRVASIKFSDLDREFGFSERRRKILYDLRSELMAILSKGWHFRGYAYGSFLNYKNDNPSDIDIILCVAVGDLETWNQINDNGNLHMYVQQIRPGTELNIKNKELIFNSLYSLSKMVYLYNKDLINNDEGFQVSDSDFIEIVID